MSYGFPSSTNTFVPSFEASGSLMMGYSRNPATFPINRYLQKVPVSKQFVYIADWFSEQGQRILNNQSLWADGQDAPTGIYNLESFEFELVALQRRQYPFTLGDLAVEQASWNVLAAHAGLVAQQCMTERTQLTYNLLNSKLNTASATSLGGGKFDVGTPTNPYLKLGLFKAFTNINKATMGQIQVKDLALVCNGTTAYKIGASQEITDNMKYVGGLTYVLDGVPVAMPGPNFGLPSQVYGFDVIIDDATILTTAKGNATQTGSYIIPDGEVLIISKQGGLEGIEGAPSWSTVQGFFMEEMTVESYHDVNNRLTRGRVVSNFTPFVSNQGVKSGLRITASVT